MITKLQWKKCYIIFPILYHCRLDFVTFVTAVGANGQCGDVDPLYDTFVVTQPTGANSNPLCGVNTGLHSKLLGYIFYPGANPIKKL